MRKHVAEISCANQESPVSFWKAEVQDNLFVSCGCQWRTKPELPAILDCIPHPPAPGNNPKTKLLEAGDVSDLVKCLHEM